ncbi:MAG: carboxypeptidase regulatory-like domain-containing protein, partial [Myxococcota bacterium]
ARLPAPEWSTIRAIASDGREGSALVDFKVAAKKEVTIELSVAMTELGTIAGSVMLPDGSPASNATVRRMGAQRGERMTETDLEGIFRLSGQPSGEYEIEASLRGYVTASQPSVSFDADDVVLGLETGAELSGTVRAAAGESVPAFQLWLGRRLGPVAVIPVRSEAFYDPDGRFVLNGLKPGTYQLVVNAFGFAPKTEHRVEVGADAESVEIVLDDGGAIRGRVVDEESGEPLADVSVALESALDDGPSVAGAALQTVTDREGRFLLVNVTPGMRGLRFDRETHHNRVVRGIGVVAGVVTQGALVALSAVAEGESKGFEIVGIGASLAPRGEGLVVLGAVPGSGAQEAGLAPEDLILEIDGTPVAELGFEGSLQRMAGVEGSTVTLTIERDSEQGETRFELSVARRKLRL